MCHKNASTRGNRFPQWDKNSPEESLDSLYCWAESMVQDSIDWYKQAKRSKKCLSLTLRILAISLGSIGSLLPLLDATNSIKGFLICRGILDSWLICVPPDSIQKWGYVFLFLAGSCVAADKLLGYSSSWIRFYMTQISIATRLDQFRIDWMATRLQANEPDTAALVGLVRALVTDVAESIDSETRYWVRDFQAQLSTLENSFADTKQQGLRVPAESPSKEPEPPKPSRGKSRTRRP